MTETTHKNPKQTSRNKKPIEVKKENVYLPVVLILVSFVLQSSFYSFDEGEYGVKNNLFGVVGHLVSKAGFYLFGKAIYIVPVVGFLSGMILFQKKDANKSRLLTSLPFLILSLSIFLHIIGSNTSSLRGLDGNKIGGLLSNFFEFILGKSGRVLMALGFAFYGLVCILKESPKKIDYEFWKKVFQSGKEKLVNSIAPEIESEIESETEQTHEKEIPWIEVKKIGTSRKIPQISDFTGKITQIEVQTPIQPTSEMQFQDLEIKSNLESVRISELKHSVQSLKREIDKEIKTPPEKIITTEEVEPEIFFKEASRDLKSKIFKSPIPIPILETNPIHIDTSEEDQEVYKELWEARDPDEIGSSIDDSVTEDELVELFSADPDELGDTSIVSSTTKTSTYSNEPEEYYPDPILEEESKEEEIETRLPFSSSVPPVQFLKKTNYKIPTKLFSTNPQKRSDPMFKLEAEYIAKKIIEIIKEYGYDSKIVAWQKGPIVTRFELSPPPGVKLSRITSLSDELRLYLAVKSIRIVAPIPGKSTIGIEVPNKYRENVHLGDIVREKGEELVITNTDLNIVLGKDSISGETISIDLTKLPHLLVAGTTGSGKSVSMNAMISYLIYSKSPEEVRFIMIDPKMVEMSLYENIPHLLLPVITDPRKATKALLWAVQEMESRYALISDLKCRDIRGYNEKVGSSLIARLRHKKMPYIVIFIDELSDLMMVSGKELEDYIIRISQKARAVGIHLVMATQRPSVDVITGIIKANCPARMAFHVAQKNDSKIILDYSGADTLLGKGDFLYKSPTSADLQRIQAPFVTEEEIEKIVQEAMTYAKAEYVSMNLDEESFKDEENDADEESFDKAWNIVKTERKASASYLQRRLRIGYNKAARIMELMEERGYVGPQIGAKPREILR
jgi:S-DNA-T family DNA segregation ATPase FtsK/SpoIIIE